MSKITHVVSVLTEHGAVVEVLASEETKAKLGWIIKIWAEGSSYTETTIPFKVGGKVHSFLVEFVNSRGHKQINLYDCEAYSYVATGINIVFPSSA